MKSPALSPATPLPIAASGCVLVVDDDRGSRATLREVLADAGYHVVQAADGTRALEYLFSSPTAEPDVVLLDLNMPTMSGWETLAIMKSYARLARLPVILVTGHKPSMDPVAHGTAQAMLQKPYATDALLELVARFADRTERE